MKKKHPLLFLLNIGIITGLFSQVYTDYIGAGHSQYVKVYTSSNHSNSIGENTINGEGLDAMKMEASRFLAQATFGGGIDVIEELAAEGNNFEAWMEEQFVLPVNLMLPALWETTARSRQLFEAERSDPDQEFFGPYSIHFNYTWSDQLYKAQDQLRHRIAAALSQILVISVNSQLRDYGEGLASFYDIFMRNAFGSYEDILNEVSIHPMMGFYLTHLNNPKEDLAAGIHPDENYAREIMQLFTIGLYELNNDGTRKVQNGSWIATYDNNDIKQLAKVFTGLSIGAFMPQFLEEYPNAQLQFGTDIYVIDKTTPMAMYQQYHDTGIKTLLGGYAIPAGQPGIKDIQDAIKHLFNHDNVGPFLALRLIQQLVKSNPTPAYINRVANAFNNNGSGVRGDMRAVIKAILLDPEARSCDAMQDPTHGKLREPLLRYGHAYKGLDVTSWSGYYWDAGENYEEDTKQRLLGAPSVFNFYTPDYQPVGEFAQMDIVGPEYKIHDTQTSIGYINQVHKWTSWNTMFWDWHNTHPDDPERDEDVRVDYSRLAELARDPESLINRLDIVFTHGRMSDGTKQILRTALNPNSWESWAPGHNDFYKWCAEIAVYITLISPDYAVLK